MTTTLRWKASERCVSGEWEGDEATWEGFEVGITQR
jgi:hypothetical protein